MFFILFRFCFTTDEIKRPKLSVMPYKYLYYIKTTDSDYSSEYGKLISIDEIPETFAAVPEFYEVRMFLSGFDSEANEAVIPFSYLLSRNFSLRSLNTTIPQYIKITVNDGESCTGKKQTFVNTRLKFTGTGTTVAKFRFLTLSNVLASGTSSVTNFILEKGNFDIKSLDDWTKKITTKMTYQITKEFIIQDDYLMTVNFMVNNIALTAKEGLKSYLTMIMPNCVPDNKKIVIKLMNKGENQPVNMLCAAESSLSLDLDLSESFESDFYAIFTGDKWETQQIDINLGYKNNFNITTKDVGKGASVPKFVVKGTGKIVIDGKEYQTQMDYETTKKGLGGGEIAGIVIACVVVVAAVAICIYLFVFKKKKINELSN